MKLLFASIVCMTIYLVSCNRFREYECRWQRAEYTTDPDDVKTVQIPDFCETGKVYWPSVLGGSLHVSAQRPNSTVVLCIERSKTGESRCQSGVDVATITVKSSGSYESFDFNVTSAMS